MDDASLSHAAIEFVKANVDQIIGEFADDALYPPTENPVSVFMAGSAGAGKTEFSKQLLVFSVQEGLPKSVRIDGDEIRERLPGYTGDNASLFQGAIALGVNKIHDYVLRTGKSFILDATFAGRTSLHNIERSLKKDRSVEINYVFQEPKSAWDVAVQRERIEGRSVPKQAFIDQFVRAYNNVEEALNGFRGAIRVNVLIRNYKNTSPKFFPNVDSLEVVPMKDSLSELSSLL